MTAFVGVIAILVISYTVRLGGATRRTADVDAVICAAARTLLRIAWAVASKKQAFEPDYAQRQVARAA
jgi:hypothetical protein